jgi:hypothetical protein
LLVQVLELVNQNNRLSSCALVSTAWQAAAVAATSKVYLSARTPEDLDSLLLYLRQHGAIVRKVFIFKAPKAEYLSQLQPAAGFEHQHMQLGESAQRAERADQLDPLGFI